METLPRESKLFLDAEKDIGAEEGGAPFVWRSNCSDRTGDGFFDGLFLTLPMLCFFPPACLEFAGSVWRFFRFASRFIQFAKGRRRACLSVASISICRRWREV